jgi:hypothetical protein
VTGTADALDADLPSTIVNFVGFHLQMKNNLERAKAEMDAASKAAQAEARAKSKTPIRIAPSKAEITQPVTTAQTIEPAKPAPLKTASLFDVPISTVATKTAPSEMEEADEPFVEIDDDGESVETAEELDNAA